MISVTWIFTFNLLDQAQIFGSLEILFFQGPEHRPIHRQHFSAGAVRFHLTQQAPGQGPGLAMHQGHGFFNA